MIISSFLLRDIDVGASSLKAETQHRRKNQQTDLFLNKNGLHNL